MSVRATEVKRGMVILQDNDLWVITDYEHITPGNWRAIHQIKLKNLKTGNQRQLRLGSSDTLELVFLDKKEAQYLYKDAQGYVFMDNESFDQFHLSEEVVGEFMKYVTENSNVIVTFHEVTPISVEVPSAVTLKVIEAEPAARGNTATSVTKMVKVETGYELKAPPHIDVGDMIKISTETGEFLSRVNK
ncbi:MAG: elongation factor P [Planctomycetes bacterium]|nr:elongation factor P [Planctomycetota bacterium]